MIRSLGSVGRADILTLSDLCAQKKFNSFYTIFTFVFETVSSCPAHLDMLKSRKSIQSFN